MDIDTINHYWIYKHYCNRMESNIRKCAAL